MKIQHAVLNTNQIHDCNASVVALDRRSEEDITLRFLMTDAAWDVHTKEVRLTKGLAEQLLQMLSEELEESSHPFHYITA